MNKLHVLDQTYYDHYIFIRPMYIKYRSDSRVRLENTSSLFSKSNSGSEDIVAMSVKFSSSSLSDSTSRSSYVAKSLLFTLLMKFSFLALSF